MGCAQVSAASQRHPTAPLPAKRPPCSTPTALATGLAPPQCSRTLPVKGGCEETRSTPLSAAAHLCREGVWVRPVAGWAERATGCAFAGASGMCLGGGMRRCQEPIEAAQSSHLPAEPRQRA